MSKIDMICFSKHNGSFFNNILYVQYVHLTKAKPIHDERGCYEDFDRKGSIAKEKFLVVNLKGYGGKKNKLAVNRQS
jgi:hypothetical protein